MPTPRFAIGDRRLPRGVTFVVATASLLLVFAAAGTPIPHFNDYLAGGLGQSGIAAAAVVYLAAAALALLVLGRLSDHVGRRPIALAAMALSIVGTLTLTTVDAEPQLLVGRILQGLGCGLATGSLGALVVDTAPERPAWLPALITGTVPMLGVPLGALASGALVDLAPWRDVLGYVLAAALLVACAVLVLLGRETRSRVPGATRSLVPQPVIPKGSGMLVLAVGAAYGATWCIGSFYQAFGPQVAQESLGSGSAVVAAAVFASAIVPGVLGGPFAGRGRPQTPLVIGILVFVVAIAGVVAGVRLGSVPVYFTAAAIAGLSGGVIATAGNRLLLPTARPEQRAGLLSTIFLICYASAAVPGLAASAIAETFALDDIAVGYGLLVALTGALSLGTLALLARRAPASD
ncbi:MFS transporter [Agrococcus jejuensis]|uniref:Predicted arabinose efflux permease, MFS family n=1 Tax=Agrococcus jejuensis TaxID=399736 RepID=A0A1G8D006_9MICO|nr:MFS transporter [Agrococcus jejuensis]SDH51106.1 Predicted arabinose efflux permease, MFS family [Agrococcus jejuensis]